MWRPILPSRGVSHLLESIRPSATRYRPIFASSTYSTSSHRQYNALLAPSSNHHSSHSLHSHRCRAIVRCLSTTVTPSNGPNLQAPAPTASDTPNENNANQHQTSSSKQTPSNEQSSASSSDSSSSSSSSSDSSSSSSTDSGPYYWLNYFGRVCIITVQFVAVMHFIRTQFFDLMKVSNEMINMLESGTNECFQASRSS